MAHQDEGFAATTRFVKGLDGKVSNDSPEPSREKEEKAHSAILISF